MSRHDWDDDLFDEEIANAGRNDNAQSGVQQSIFLAFPFVSGFVSFATYQTTWEAFHEFVEWTKAQNTWQAVDGGMFEAQSIATILNGPFLVAVGLLLATLVSMTISSLHERQIVVRASILQEVEDLRFLRQLLLGFPTHLQPLIQRHADRYTRELFRNVMSKMTDPRAVMQDTALKNVLLELNTHVVDEASGVPPELVSQFYGTIASIKMQRSQRINAQASFFPATHYLLLGLLASSIGLAFLLEGNEEVFFFLDEWELAVCWAIINGTFSSLGVVLYDLNTFHGYYSLFGTQNDSLMVHFYRYAMNQGSDDPQDTNGL